MTLIERSYWEQLTDHHDASADDKVWGAAYRITPEKVAEVKDYLDIREINGYTIHYTPFHPATGTSTPTTSSTTAGGPIQTLVYIGTPDNEQFVGPQDPQALAEHIYRSEGPSGLNRDYLLGLERSLDELSPTSGDEHVTDLSDRVRTIAAKHHRHGDEGLGPELGGTEPGQEQRQADAGNLRSPSSVTVSRPQAQELRDQQHREYQQHHEFRKVSSVDEQEEAEKTS